MVTTETTKMEIIQEFERLLGRKLEEPAIQKLEKAIQLAEIAYEGLYRKSGEPFISHPIEVAKIVADLKLDPRWPRSV